MLTPEDHKKLHYLGRTSTMTELANLMRGVTVPAERAESYAAGMAEGIREFVTAFIGEKAAYDMLQGAADRTSAHRRVQIGSDQSS